MKKKKRKWWINFTFHVSKLTDSFLGKKKAADRREINHWRPLLCERFSFLGVTIIFQHLTGWGESVVQIRRLGDAQWPKRRKRLFFTAKTLLVYKETVQSLCYMTHSKRYSKPPNLPELPFRDLNLQHPLFQHFKQMEELSTID